jgi:putative membrane protein
VRRSAGPGRACRAIRAFGAVPPRAGTIDAVWNDRAEPPDTRRIAMNRTRVVLVPTVLAALVVTAACTKKEGETATDTAAVPPAPAMANSTSTAAGAPTSSAALTDPNIVYILDQANAADSARGKLAESKATSADVKGFGRLMVGEHHALRAQGQQLAKKLSVTPQAPSGDQSEAQTKQEMDSLNAMSKGAAWDKAYIDYEVTYHQQVLQTATKALDAAQNQELKDLIKKAAPVIQHHLDRAQQIQKKLGPAA